MPDNENDKIAGKKTFRWLANSPYQFGIDFISANLLSL